MKIDYVELEKEKVDLKNELTLARRNYLIKKRDLTFKIESIERKQLDFIMMKIPGIEK